MPDHSLTTIGAMSAAAGLLLAACSAPDATGRGSASAAEGVEAAAGEAAVGEAAAGQAGATAVGDTASGGPAPDEARPTLELLDAGRAPREPLRYRLEPGRVTATMDVAVTYEHLRVDGQRLPTPPTIPVSADIAFDVEEVTAPGDALIRFHYAEVRLGATPDLPPLQRADVERQLGFLEQVAGRFTMDGLGAIHDLALTATPPPGFEQIADEFANLTVPLPSEPVGPGARWAVTDTVEANGVRTDRRTSVEVLAREGGDLRLAVTVEGSSPPGAIDVPQASGAPIKLLRSQVVGRGESAIDLTRPLAFVGWSSATIDQELRTHEGTIQQRLHMEVSFRPAG